MLRLPRIPQFRNRLLLAVRNEDRVVAEAFVASRLARDPAEQGSGAAQLAAVGCKKDELRDVVGAAVLHPVELA
jgi:hypothetical protein